MRAIRGIQHGDGRSVVVVNGGSHKPLAMPLERSAIVRTPGKIVFDPTNANAALRIPLYSDDDGITWDIEEELVKLPNLVFGGTTDIVTARLAKCEITPTAFTAAALAKCFTHQAAYSTMPGGSIIGSTDKLLDIVTMDGQARRMASAFVYGEPPLRCETGKTIMGKMTIYGIIGLDGDSSELDDLLTLEAQAWSDADYNAAHMITPGWFFGWRKWLTDPEDADTMIEIETMQGVTITPKSELTDFKNPTSGKGLRDVGIDGYSVEVKASAFNITEDMTRAARFANGTQAIGTQKNSLGADIVLNANGGGAFIRVKNAVLQPNQWKAHPKNTVVNELTWTSQPINSRSHLVVSTADPDA